MSLSTALSLETLTSDELFAASERDLSELWQFYDRNSNGLIEYEEFEALISEVVNRMGAQLPAAIPAKYCAQYGLDPSVMEGVEQRIAARFNSVSRPDLAKALFLALDVIETASSASATATDAAVGEDAAAEGTAAVSPKSAPSVAGDDDADGGADGLGSIGTGSVRGARGFLEPVQLQPLHALVEKHLLSDLYESIGAIMVQKQLSALDRV